MMSLLITVLGQPKREDTLRVRGYNNQKYMFRWARLGGSGHYAYQPSTQEEVDNLFRSPKTRFGVYALTPPKVELVEYNGLSPEELRQICKQLGLDTKPSDTGPTMKRIVQAYMKGAGHG